MIRLDTLDNHAKALLNEVRDDASAAFPQVVRVSAIQEAVLSIARGRPDLFSVKVDIPLSGDGDRTFRLGDAYDRMLEIHSVTTGDGRVISLAVASASEMHTADDCWLHADRDPTTAVWSSVWPRHVRLDGNPGPDAKINAVVSRIDYEVDGNINAEVPLSPTYFSALIDLTLARLRTREDTSAMLIGSHMQFYGGAMSEAAQNLQALNPLAAFRAGQRNP